MKIKRCVNSWIFCEFVNRVNNAGIFYMAGHSGLDFLKTSKNRLKIDSLQSAIYSVELFNHNAPYNSLEFHRNMLYYRNVLRDPCTLLIIWRRNVSQNGAQFMVVFSEYVRFVTAVISLLLLLLTSWMERLRIIKS